MSAKATRMVKGLGAHLWDQASQCYVDANTISSGVVLGHNHPAVREAITHQSAHGLGWIDSVPPPQVTALQTQLNKLSGMAGGFFTQHQTMAAELAIKIARLYGKQRGVSSPQILVFEGAYHGDTLATISASHQRRTQAGLEPLMPGFIRAPLNRADLIETIANNKEDIVAVLIEPIQLHSGVQVAEADFLGLLQEYCQTKQWLLMLDESHCGMGRSGYPFYYQSHPDLQPDLLIIGNSLANGIPIGYCGLSETLQDFCRQQSYPIAHQYAPIGIAAANAVLESVVQEKMFDQATQRSESLMNQLILSLCHFPVIKQIRGRGFLVAIAHDNDCGHLPAQLQAQGLLVGCVDKHVITLAPPINTDDGQIDSIVSALETVYRSQFGII